MYAARIALTLRSSSDVTPASEISPKEIGFSSGNAVSDRIRASAASG
ncbi:MAG: hypothetical protein QGG92_05050 [Dehalococcoidia bacterium]|nr:hypothetical protein [Dehalococcoidia bacterium]